MSQYRFELSAICRTFPSQLNNIPEEVFNFKAGNRWSKKEILGHLVDSAMVNLQRFIRGQIENKPVIGYDQDSWVAVQHYHSYPSEDLIRLWETLNNHLIQVVTCIPAKNLECVCLMRDGRELSLAFIIQDYVDHLRHHMAQILS